MFVSFLYMKLDIKIILLPAWTTVCHKYILLDVVSGFYFIFSIFTFYVSR